jgi:type I restriction enzyme R subunit
MKLIADILLISVNSTEGRAVLDVFKDATGAKSTLVDIGNHAFHDLGSVNGLRVAMVQCEMGSVGLGASLQTAQEAIATTQPGAVIMVGVAFGANSSKQQIGEVLVSKQIAAYEPQRVGVSGGKSNIVPRGPKADASTKLLSHFRAIDLSWDPRPAKVAFGLILSGEKLVDNPDFRASLLELEPEALGGEMEGAGLYAACQNAKCDWILTKGICDWADGHKGDNKDANQQLAALNAAKFVFHALKTGTLNFKSDLTTRRARRISGSAAVSPAITITINKTLDDFGLDEQAALVTTVASLGHVSKDEVQVLQVSDGSVKVLLTMPESGAHKLRDAWQTGSGAQELKALGVTLLEVKHVPQPTADLTLRDRLHEKALEDVVVNSLAESALYKYRPAESLDQKTLVDAETLAEFVKSTQPTQWAKLARQFPGEERETLAAQVSALVAKRGTLEVLRNGVSFSGINLQLAFFRPSGEGNPEHQAQYERNLFGVMRQVHFSTKTPDQSVDGVILLNGLPIVSIELKNHFTGQNVQHAIAQYKRRDQREPFWSRCLVHFAVDDDSVYMATQVQGKETPILPFNRDTHNPIIPERFTSSYLWDDFIDEYGEAQTGILRADSLLLLIQNYLHHERDDKTGNEKFIFPRFHQLMVVRKLLRHAKEHGSGRNYLIQHSAGSGKSNSIAWLAHQLANLSGEDGQPVFDSIVVITDRIVLDRQLQGTIKQFEKIKGVVTAVRGGTKQLVAALKRGDKIIITTLQKFGFVGELAKLPGKKFAIIVDEAHSSQTGENVKDLKIALTNDEQLKAAMQKDDEREVEDPIEVELEKIQKARQRLPHLSFFAFTATPKDKTLELFGTPDKTVKKGFRPFHGYSMRQAIDEGFILDVLQSYTTYKTYFELAENEKAEGEKLVEELKARRLLLAYVDQHEFAIKRKAHIIVDHFTRKTARKIGGQAKAMVVTHSRAHAVLYKQAIDEVLREQNLPFGVLVAFSGTVTIKEQKYTEENMNPPGTGDIGEAFKNPVQRILVVANKFQTGFDQPLLHTMYVDKKLGGVAAVQTLSRLNRTFPPLKQDTMVLDFVNEHDAIRASFQDYYQRTELEGGTDPNKLYNLKYTLEQMRVFTAEDVEQFAVMFIEKKVTSEKLQPFFQRIVDTGYENLGSEHKGKKDYEKLKAQAKDKFRKETARYVRQYTFISQIMTFSDPILEKFYLFAKLLLKKLPYEKQTLPREVMEMVDMEKYRSQEEQNGSIILAEEDAALHPTLDDGHRGGTEEAREKLKVIVEKLNKDYGIAFDEADRVVNAIKHKLEEDEALRAAFKTSSIEFLRRQKLNDSIKEAFLSNADEFLTFMSKTETDPAFGKFFFSEMFKWYEKTVTATSPNPESS